MMFQSIFNWIIAWVLEVWLLSSIVVISTLSFIILSIILWCFIWVELWLIVYIIVRHIYISLLVFSRHIEINHLGKWRIHISGHILAYDKGELLWIKIVWAYFLWRPHHNFWILTMDNDMKTCKGSIRTASILCH